MYFPNFGMDPNFFHPPPATDNVNFAHLCFQLIFKRFLLFKNQYLSAKPQTDS